MTDAQKRAAKASQIRKKVKDGKYVADNEREWLAQYEQLVKPRSKELPLLPSHPEPANTPRPRVSVDSIDIAVYTTKPDTSQDFKMPGFDAPLPEGETATPPGLDEQPASPGTKSKPLEAEVVDEKKESAQASAEAKAQGKAAADYYCAWLVKMSGECEAMGGIGIPKEIVNTLFHYAATGTFTRLAQSVGGEMSETMQDITVLAGGAGMYVQRHMLRAKQAENGPEQPSQPSTTPKKVASFEGAAETENKPSNTPKKDPKVQKNFHVKGMLSGKEF